MLSNFAIDVHTFRNYHTTLFQLGFLTFMNSNFSTRKLTDFPG